MIKESKETPGYGCNENGEIFSRKNGRWGLRDDWKKLNEAVTTGGYKCFNAGRGNRVLSHRFVFITLNEYNPDYIDHIDRNPLNNRIENLRVATAFQNAQNTSIREDNNTGFKGISFNKQNNNYRARIIVNKVRIELGSFVDLQEAIDAYELASKLYHKDFSIFN